MAFEQLPLGKTGLKVARLGIGVGYHINAKAMALAVENGINYIFWGSLKFRTVPKALKLLGKNRDKAIIAVPCYGTRYTSSPKWINFSLNQALRTLKRDYLDIFQLGWLEETPKDAVMETVLKLKEQGKIRHLGMTTHNRKLAAQMLKDPNFEVFNIRYNAANRGAEREIFPFAEERHAIVNFTSTRWGQLLKPVPGWQGKVPTAADCYRFVLSRPEVSVCLTGAKNIKELRENVKVLNMGPMVEEELNWMREFGDLVYTGKSHIMESKADKQDEDFPGK